MATVVGMRMLLPEATDDVDLLTAYAYPDGGRWVRANMVSSVDGAASLDGRTGALGGSADRRVFAALRGLADVILVGAATAKVERYGPADVKSQYAAPRAASGQRPAPPIAVVTRSLELDLETPLFAQADDRTIVITCAAADPARRAAVADVADVIVAGEEWVDLMAAVEELVARGLPRILCEGGPRLLADVVAGGVLDELCLTVGPLLTAGPAIRILNGPAFDAPIRLELAHVLDEDGALFLRYVRRA